MTDLTLLHLTDIHAAAPGGPSWLGQDADANLRLVVETVSAMTLELAAVVVSGDVVNEPSTASYEAFNGSLETLRTLGVPVFLCLGNHDDRALFRGRVLGTTGGDPRTPYCYSAELAGLRLLVLDTGGGTDSAIEVDAGQLEWLEGALAAPPPAGILVAMHHPPLPTAVPDLSVRLGNVERLRRILTGQRVRGILCGHVHFGNLGCFAGALCAAAPATVALMDPSTQDGNRHMAGSGFNLVHLTEGELIVNPIHLPGPQTELTYRRHGDGG